MSYQAVGSNGSIAILADILNFNQSRAKSISHTCEQAGKPYLSLIFAIVEHNINALEFGDPLFSGIDFTDLRVDETTVFDSLIYTETDKGIFHADTDNPDLIDFNNWQTVILGDVRTYPRLALNFHNTVTMDSRNVTLRLVGISVKILDIAGALVYETNVVEGQELQERKVVWDKTNLVGKRVVLGIYIVLLINGNDIQTTATKIAIIN